MSLRRYEFGIARVTDAHIEVYARQASGRTYFKTYPIERAGDVLETAEADFRQSPQLWRVQETSQHTNVLSRCWNDGAQLFVCSEAAIEAHVLFEQDVDVVISLNLIRSQTRQQIAAFLDARPQSVHVNRPLQDVLPKFQTADDAAAVRESLEVAILSLREGRNVVAHCLMGIHRSPSFAAVALHRAGYSPSPREAFRIIQKNRPVASWFPETIEWMMGEFKR